MSNINIAGQVAQLETSTLRVYFPIGGLTQPIITLGGGEVDELPTTLWEASTVLVLRIKRINSPSPSAPPVTGK